MLKAIFQASDAIAIMTFKHMAGRRRRRRKSKNEKQKFLRKPKSAGQNQQFTWRIEEADSCISDEAATEKINKSQGSAEAAFSVKADLAKNDSTWIGYRSQV